MCMFMCVCIFVCTCICSKFLCMYVFKCTSVYVLVRCWCVYHIYVYVHLCYICIRVCMYTHASIHVPACICLSLVELCLTSKACWCHCSSANILFLLCKAWPRVSPWRVQLIPSLRWRTTSKLLEARSLVFFVICILLSMDLSVLVRLILHTSSDILHTSLNKEGTRCSLSEGWVWNREAALCG